MMRIPMIPMIPYYEKMASALQVLQPQHMAPVQQIHMQMTESNFLKKIKMNNNWNRYCTEKKTILSMNINETHHKTYSKNNCSRNKKYHNSHCVFQMIKISNWMLSFNFPTVFIVVNLLLCFGSISVCIDGTNIGDDCLLAL